MSSAFTTDLYPLLSLTKVSPCFSDIVVPTEVDLPSLSFLFFAYFCG
jgi:hypothetical protein